MDLEISPLTADSSAAVLDNPTLSPSPCLGLDQLERGQSATVVRVDLLDDYGDRLAELGLTPGAAVEVLRKGWWQGPMVIRVRDYTLSLRRQQAHHVCVERPVCVARQG